MHPSVALEAAQPANNPSSSYPEQLVTFRIDNRLLGIDVAVVREIRGFQPVTPLPNGEPAVLGVLNLRGTIVAVYDARRKLGIAEMEPSPSNVVIVLDGGTRQIGIVVDAVSDILPVDESEIRPAPQAVDHDLVTKLVVKNDAVIAILNVSAFVRGH